MHTLAFRQPAGLQAGGNGPVAAERLVGMRFASTAVPSQTRPRSGAAGVEVAQSVLAETQSAILPLVPHLDTLRWVFIAVALGGIAVTIWARLDDWHRGLR